MGDDEEAGDRAAMEAAAEEVGFLVSYSLQFGRDFRPEFENKLTARCAEGRAADAGCRDVAEVGLAEGAAGAELDSIEKAGERRPGTAPDCGLELKGRGFELTDGILAGPETKDEPRTEMAVKPAGGGKGNPAHRVI